jgi:hypothetical protein
LTLVWDKRRGSVPDSRYISGGKDSRFLKILRPVKYWNLRNSDILGAWSLRGFSFSAAECLVCFDGHPIASFVLGVAAMAQDMPDMDIVLGE